MTPSIAFFTLLTACGGCADQDAAKKSSATASDKPGKSATLDGEGQGAEAPPIEPIPSATDKVAEGATGVGIVQVGDKAVVISKGRQATLRVPVEGTQWNGWALERRQGKGISVIGVTESQWWRPGDYSADARPIGDLLAEKGTLDEWITSQAIGSQGAQRVHVNLDGRKERLGVFDSAPTASLYFEPKVPVPAGAKAAPRLGRTSGFAKADDGSWAAEPPTGATAVAPAAGSAEQQGTWKTDLAGQRGADVRITWSQVVDLDQDGAPEAVVCADGGTADFDCYVFDEVAGERRYHGLAGMRLGGTMPFAFQKDGATYVAHVPPTPEGSPARAALLLVRWDGSRYAFEGL